MAATLYFSFINRRIPFIVFITVLSSFSTLAFGKGASGDTAFIDTTMPSSIPAEIIADWKLADSIDTDYSAAIAKIKSKLPTQYAIKIDTGSTEALYIKACHWRRVWRMKDCFENYSNGIKRILYARHPFLSALSFIDPNYTGPDNRGSTLSGLTEQNNDNQNNTRSALLLLNFENYYPKPLTLLEDTTNVIRDPCVSFDGKKIAFAWSKCNVSLINGCFHIFEMNAGKPDSIRQLTSDLPDYQISDFEPCYLPNGDILFNSTRCFQGCATFPFIELVGNLFIMNKDGKYLRRICYDQAHDFRPTVMSSGKIMFSRWEFNDRTFWNVFGVFTMNPDGSLQNEYFGNQLTWPNTFASAREIPDSRGKFLAIISTIFGGIYQGDLVIIDPSKGRNSFNAIQLIAPKRPVPQNADKLTGVFETNTSVNFQDPYPLDENWFLISYSTRGTGYGYDNQYKFYLMNVNGDRELLAWDTAQSIGQPFPLCERKASRLAYQTDYSKTTAQVTMANAYYGMGIDSTIKSGVIKKIRVIALEYRAFPWVGTVGGGPPIGTPIARNNGSIESKRIVGEMKVESDGSAAFIVPARTPLYVQLIDSSGCTIQSMRSWMTLQPGEKFDCIGCHEDKNGSPPLTGTPIASTPIILEPFYDIADGYLYYPKEIQPILNAKCISCHTAGHSSNLDLTGDKIWTGELTNTSEQYAQRYWCKSYLNLTDTLKGLVHCIPNNSSAEGLKPNTQGSGHSKLIAKLQQRSGAMTDVVLSEKEMAKLCAWIDLCIPHSGKYTDDMDPGRAKFYEQRLLPRKQEDSLEAQNIAEFIKDGGYAGKGYNGIFIINDNQGKAPFKNTLHNDPLFQVRFLHSSRQLVMKLPSAGNVTFVDLQGRRVLVVNISNEEYLKSPVRHFPIRNLSGMYIAKFKGKTGAASRVVPIL
jgi:hypothetical protein